MKDQGIVDIDLLADATNVMDGLGLTPIVSPQSLSGLSLGAGKSFVNETLKSLPNKDLVTAFIQAPMHSKIIFLNELKNRGVQIILDLDGGSSRQDVAHLLKDEKFVFVDGMMDEEVAEQVEKMISMSDCHMSPINGGDVDHQKAAILLDGCRSLFKERKPKKFYQKLNQNSRGKYRR